MNKGVDFHEMQIGRIYLQIYQIETTFITHRIR